ncbi:hypothetical protein HanLR1_Chr10g0372051 [Helianthus annuus]|nr:hypothetical protein HanHA89_Chr10g0394691 [Helianthus annuus]KAJ0697704.1 hypothetical protein HanLR1_Chr10g0372051 [Helianthus annuus]
MTQPSYALTRADAGRVRPCLSLRGPRENRSEALYKQAIGFHSNSFKRSFSITISVEGLLYSGIMPPN